MGGRIALIVALCALLVGTGAGMGAWLSQDTAPGDTVGPAGVTATVEEIEEQKAEEEAEIEAPDADSSDSEVPEQDASADDTAEPERADGEASADDTEETEPAPGTFETKGDNIPERNQNLKVACEKLDGYVLQPQEVLSFNEITGPYTYETGYQDASVLVAQEMTAGIGGGVCQVATTLYNAALLGGLTIEESHAHTVPTSYVAVGRDAAVSEPYYDLKIKNDRETPVTIRAKAENGTVTVSFEGDLLEEGVTVSLDSVVKEEIAPEGEEITYTDELPAGERRIIREEQTGYKTALYRIYCKEGAEISRELISEEEYPAANAIVEIGRGELNK